MRDVLLKFGAISVAGDCPDVIDFEASEKEGNLDNFNAVFTPSADAKGVVVKLLHSADNGTYEDLITGHSEDVAAGDSYVIPFPKKHKRYVKMNVTGATSGEGYLTFSSR